MEYDIDSPSTGLFASIPIENQAGYATAAHAINNSHADVVSIQHEFGIFGGREGEHILDLISKLNRPVVSTLHTTSPLLPPKRRGILQNIIRASQKIIVLADESASLLRTEYAGAAK